MEVQRHVLQNPVLSLRDLAKLAPTSKMFQAVCRERCETDLAWLTGTTYSILSRQVVHTLLQLLLHPVVERRKRRRCSIQAYQLAEPEDCPGERALLDVKLLTVCAPAWGALQPGQGETVFWRMHRGRDDGRAILRLEIEGFSLNLNYFPGWLNVSIIVIPRPDEPAGLVDVVPVLGVALLACQLVSERQLLMREEHIRGHQSRPAPGPITIPVEWDGAGPLSEEAQRALSAFLMWNWRFRANPLV